jgi:hypothetical protein
MSDGTVVGAVALEEIVSTQRTARGRAYDSTRAALRQLIQTDKDFRNKRNAEVARIKAVGPSDVHSNTFLSNLSIQYANDMYIGERVAPVVAVPFKSDDYFKYSKRDRLAIPDDMIGSRSDANEVDENRETASYSCKDRALKGFVSADTIENQDSAFDEMMDLVESVNDGLGLAREKRVATLITTAANYDSNNTATLAGADQFDSAGGGDPVKKIQEAKRACWGGRGPSKLVLVSGVGVYNCLARHQAVRDMFKYTSLQGSSGLATPSMIASIFGLDEYLVGGAREDTANSGQTASYSDVWGKHLAIVRVALRPSKRNASFSYTFRMQGHPLTTQWFDPTKGLGGGYFAKVGCSETHDVVANDTGFLYRSAIS